MFDFLLKLPDIAHKTSCLKDSIFFIKKRRDIAALRKQVHKRHCTLSTDSVKGASPSLAGVGSASPC